MRIIKHNTRTDKANKKPNIIHLKSIGVCEGHLCVVVGNEMSVKKLRGLNEQN